MSCVVSFVDVKLKKKRFPRISLGEEPGAWWAKGRLCSARPSLLAEVMSPFESIMNMPFRACHTEVLEWVVTGELKRVIR